jgi:hypothetical protein
MVGVRAVRPAMSPDRLTVRSRTPVNLAGARVVSIQTALPPTIDFGGRLSSAGGTQMSPMSTWALDFLVCFPHC